MEKSLDDTSAAPADRLERWQVWGFVLLFAFAAATVVWNVAAAMPAFLNHLEQEREKREAQERLDAERTQPPRREASAAR